MNIVKTATYLNDPFYDVETQKDRKLLGLLKAREYWHLSAMASHKEKRILVVELHGYAMFSLNQLAKICRLSVPTVARHLKKNAVGGKFSPEVLHHMIYLRKLVLIKTHIPNSLIRSMVETDTSISMIARVTGASQTSLYLKTVNN